MNGQPVVHYARLRSKELRFVASRGEVSPTLVPAIQTVRGFPWSETRRAYILSVQPVTLLSSTTSRGSGYPVNTATSLTRRSPPQDIR